MVSERRPLVEDDHWWKTTFDERGPLVEDNCEWNSMSDDSGSTIFFV